MFSLPRGVRASRCASPCAAVTNQFGKYYRNGTYDNCPDLFIRWRTCLSMKLSKPEEAQAMQQREWRDSVSGEHVLPFKPEYQEEAYQQYGVSVSAPA